MAAISAVQVAPRNVAIRVASDPQINPGVTEATKSVFQQVKQKAIWVWKITVLTFEVGGTKVAFVFFRVIGIVSPNFALRLENGYLYVCDLIQSVKNARREREIREEIDLLRVQNRDLTANLQALRLVGAENAQMVREREHLRRENQFLTERQRVVEGVKDVLEERVQALEQQQRQIVDREAVIVRDRGALVEERNLLVQRNEALLQENGLLQGARNRAQEELHRVQQENETLRGQVEGELPVLRSELVGAKQRAQLTQQLVLIEQAAQQMQTRSDWQKTQLDDGLERILPLLVQQVKDARQSLQIIQPQVKMSTALQEGLRGVDGALDEISQLLEQVPKVLSLHSLWQNPLVRAEG